MKNTHVIDELSAYIDGEAQCPERIARHLQQCADCARRHMELSKMSAHLKALPPTEPHPAFLTRVMAGVSETQQAPRRTWQLSWSAGSFAAAVLVLGACFYFFAISRTATPDMVARTEPLSAPKQLDENVLMAQIEERLALGNSTSLLEADDTLPYADGDATPEALAETTADDLVLLAGRQLYGEVADDADPEPTLDTTLATLDDSEAETFATLLDEYARKDVTS